MLGKAAVYCSSRLEKQQMECFSYLCKRSRIGEWLKYLCFEKHFHFLNIEVYRIIHWFRPLSLYSVFSPFITNILEHILFIFMSVRKELNGCQLPPHTSGPTIICSPHLRCFGYNNLMFVYFMLLLLKYANKGLHMKYGSVWKCFSTLGTFGSVGASYPSGLLNHRPVKSWDA